ncbi:MAG: maleylacetoacetate isomerase [Bdellovibrionota bacterium]|nr:maleylacetoacetate isomerase [Bdellovibrionota bacterium]
MYSYFRSSCSYRVRIALHHKGIDYEYRPIHLVKDGGEQRKDDYLALNPKGEVPFLIDGELKLGQSMAILLYLEDKWSERPLFPKKVAERAQCIQVCEIINSGIQPIQNLGVMHEVKKRYDLTDEQKMDWSRFWIQRGLDALEKVLGPLSGKFCLGDNLTAADLFLIPQVYNGKRFGVDLSGLPIISKINDSCLELESFKLADPSCQPDSP